MYASAPGVLVHDLTRGIPLPDASCQVVYHSNLLEHLPHMSALPFLVECKRVLVPGGIIRIAIPDLEAVCRLYLERLEHAIAGEPGSTEEYTWMVIELLDQLVRDRSGGEMADFLRQQPLPAEAFVTGRIGCLVNEIRKIPIEARPAWRLFASKIKYSLQTMHKNLFSTLIGPTRWRTYLTGKFQLSGEMHRWMYDRYSLAMMLQQAGFINVERFTASTSLIPEWTRFNLDTSTDGTVIQPDSLIMEAIRATE